MATAIELNEYLDEIRREVCARCIEKPPGGPPCAPLGKACGIELHLPQLIESIHQVDSPSIVPYLDHNRSEICAKCSFLHSSICPCPMDYLSVLLVEAVEEVDRRREAGGAFQEHEAASEEHEPLTISELFEAASGTWTGCDWHTYFGDTGLDLQNCTAEDARRRAETMTGRVREDWDAAASWLARVERFAAQAEYSAELAAKAASKGNWDEAVHHAEWAWAIEFMTGRPIRRGEGAAWKALKHAVQAAYRANTSNRV
jgi:hypothetical protein